MSPNRKILFLVGIVLLFTLTACGPDLGGVLPDPDGEDSGENADLTDQQQADLAAEGDATLHYHYLMDHPYLEFKLEPVIPLTFSEDSPGQWSAGGIAEYTVDFRESGGTTANICNAYCQVILRFSAEGKFQLDPNTGACTLPMQFVFQPQADEWILETDCPPEAEEFINCATLSMNMIDPSVYTFTKSKRDVKLPSDPQVTLRAELKGARLPAGMQGVCDW